MLQYLVVLSLFSVSQKYYIGVTPIVDKTISSRTLQEYNYSNHCIPLLLAELDIVRSTGVCRIYAFSP